MQIAQSVIIAVQELSVMTLLFLGKQRYSNMAPVDMCVLAMSVCPHSSVDHLHDSPATLDTQHSVTSSYLLVGGVLCSLE